MAFARELPDWLRHGIGGAAELALGGMFLFGVKLHRADRPVRLARRLCKCVAGGAHYGDQDDGEPPRHARETFVARVPTKTGHGPGAAMRDIAMQIMADRLLATCTPARAVLIIGTIIRVVVIVVMMIGSVTLAAWSRAVGTADFR